MANLKEVRVRIASVISTQQITKAMKMVSAAKLRRAQEAIVQMRPYAAKLREIMENVSGTLDNSTGGDFSKVRPVKKVLIIAINSNRGLCGAFNANINRTAHKLSRKYFIEGKTKVEIDYVTIGKKASDYFKRMGGRILASYDDIYNHLTFDNASQIADKLMKEFADGAYDKVEIVYNQFKNAAVQYVITEQLLPIAPPQNKKQETKNTKQAINDYIFEPDKEQLVVELIPKAIKIQLYKALLDSHASEHGARMTAMNKATDNAGDILKALRLEYNKRRQAAITGEILEIVAGAEALNG